MSKVIEISDSEDEIEAESAETEATVPTTTTTPCAEPQPQRTVEAPAPTATNSTNSISTTTTKTTASSTTRVRNRRKSMHHPMCVSPEMHFETIPLDDDENATVADSKKDKDKSAESAEQHTKVIKPYKTTPKILSAKTATKTTIAELSDAACIELFMDDETNALLRRIAEERVRVNFLLATYHMPEIRFSAISSLDVLKLQLKERLEQLQIQRMRQRNH